MYLDNNNLGCYKYDFENDNCLIHCDDTDECSGNVPESIGNLTNLKSLYLYNNNLSGQIPESICNIYTANEKYQSYFHNNELCPPYPECIPENHLGPQSCSP